MVGNRRSTLDAERPAESWATQASTSVSSARGLLNASDKDRRGQLADHRCARREATSRRPFVVRTKSVATRCWVKHRTPAMGAAAATARASFGAVIPRLSLDRDLEQSTSIENGGRGKFAQPVLLGAVEKGFALTMPAGRSQELNAFSRRSAGQLVVRPRSQDRQRWLPRCCHGERSTPGT